MEYALILMGLAMILDSYKESKSDNSILSEQSLKTILRTIFYGYALGAIAILTGIVLLCANYFFEIIYIFIPFYITKKSTYFLFIILKSSNYYYK